MKKYIIIIAAIAAFVNSLLAEPATSGPGIGKAVTVALDAQKAADHKIEPAVPIGQQSALKTITQGAGVRAEYFGQAVLLPFGHQTVLAINAPWEVESIKISNRAIQFDYNEARKEITVRCVNATPCVLVVSGKAGEHFEVLLVPDRAQ